MTSLECYNFYSAPCVNAWWELRQCLLLDTRDCYTFRSCCLINSVCLLRSICLGFICRAKVILIKHDKSTTNLYIVCSLYELQESLRISLSVCVRMWSCLPLARWTCGIVPVKYKRFVNWCNVSCSSNYNSWGRFIRCPNTIVELVQPGNHQVRSHSNETSKDKLSII